MSDNTNLEIEFLSQQDHFVACDKSLLSMEGKTIQCIDRRNKQLSNKVQVTQTLVHSLLEQTQQTCKTNEQLSRIARLLVAYAKLRKTI